MALLKYMKIFASYFFNNASYLMSYSFHFSPHHISFSHSRVVQQAVAAQGAGDGHDPLHQRQRLR
jgi:hypothetical protein